MAKKAKTKKEVKKTEAQKTVRVKVVNEVPIIYKESGKVDWAATLKTEKERLEKNGHNVLSVNF